MEHGTPTESSSTSTRIKAEVAGQQIISPGQKADDNLSIKSSDSVTTSGEYEIVPEAPCLLGAVDSAASNFSPPLMSSVAAAPEEQKNFNPLEPVRDPKQPLDLNLSECLEEDEVVVSLPAIELSKADAISPILNIEGNGDVMELEKNMDEVIHELDEERTLSASDGDPTSANKTCFAKAFQRILPPSLPASMTTSLADNNINIDIAGNPIQSAMYEFSVSLELKEKEKSGYITVPRDAKSSFRLRCNTDKEVCIVVKQIPSANFPPLFIERCFGVLLSPGKIVRQADMQLLAMVNMGYVKPDTGTIQPDPMTASLTSLSEATALCQLPYQIRAEWKASDKAFQQLNTETHK